MRTFRTGGTWGAAIVALVLFATDLRADWIQLESGVQIHGKILRQTDKEITLELDRGGVSSFDMKTVASVHRVEPETRKKLPLDEEKQEKDPLPPGLHPRPDAVRSLRRPVPGGTLLLPENAVREPPPEVDPAAPEPRKPQFEAIYRVGRTECRIRIGREAWAGEEAAEERLRDRILQRPATELLALEAQKIAGLPTWVAEWRTRGPEGESRSITGWVRIDSETVRVVQVELPEEMFAKNPYRYRVIPRSYRPQEPQGNAPTAAAPRN